MRKKIDFREGRRARRIDQRKKGEREMNSTAISIGGLGTRRL